MSSLTNGRILQACHEACGQSALERGRGSVARGEVLSCRWDPGRKRLSGEISAEAGDRFETSVDILNDRRGLRLEGDCSCPEGYNCLHVAALTIEWLRQRERDSDKRNALSAWRSALRRYHPRAARRVAPEKGECLIYSVSMPVYRDTPLLTVEVSRVRRLKKGGYGKPSRVSPADYASYRLREILDGHDEYILSLLQGLRNGGAARTRVELAGELGALAFGRMVESGRCFVDRSEIGPLMPGPAREPELRWVSAESGIRLIVEIPGLAQDWLLTPTDPGYYIDPVSGECGKVAGELSGALLAQLGQLPPLDPGQASQVARDLVTDEALGALPPPVALDIRPLGDVTPVPRLTILARGPGKYRYSASLEMVYQGYALSHVMVDAREKLVAGGADDGPDVLVSRDVAAELDAVDTLGNLGFRIRREGDTLLVLSGDNDGAEAVFWADFIGQGKSSLESAGWEILTDAEFSLRVLAPERWSLASGSSMGANAGGNDWFSVALEVEVDGQKLPVLPIILQWLEGTGGDPGVLDPDRELLVPVDSHSWIRIPGELVRPVVATLLELLDDSRESAPEEAIATPVARAPLWLELEAALRDQGADIGPWALPESVRELAARLAGFEGIRPLDAPVELQGKLRDYQRSGLGWLQFLRECGFGGVLADDMGLGKTVQVLAHLIIEKSAGRLSGPSLVVVPTSLVSNWRREAARFAPGLDVLVLHGNDRHARLPDITRSDLVITTYSLLPRDAEYLRGQSFSFVILDEAQWIKNPATKAAKVVFTLDARHRLCVTGTPLENHLGELWSQFHFLMPGYLGSEAAFRRRFRHPIERQGDDMRRAALAARIRPFVLRRTKSQVAAELPDKIEMERLVTMEGRQAALYETVRATMEARVRRAIRDSGITRSRITVLDALLRMRQVCCDPRLLKTTETDTVARSAKLDLLMQMLPELVSEGRRILLFSQFTTMLGLIEDELVAHGITFSKLTGRTRKRDAAIDAFQRGDASVFLVSLKAGGVGLNLTAADTVVLYDPWWNPAVERQAIDRAHRIGQDKTVFVYRLIVENSIEEKIVALQDRKQALADNLIESGGEALPGLDPEELLALFHPEGSTDGQLPDSPSGAATRATAHRR